MGQGSKQNINPMHVHVILVPGAVSTANRCIQHSRFNAHLGKYYGWDNSKAGICV